jgi:multiple sugar transport system permease protein
MMMSPLVIGYFWKFILDGSFGVLNYLISFLGIPPQQWTIDLTLAKASIVLVDVWQWTPFVILILLAGLQSVPPQLYEAATLDRASTWMQFTRITLPYLTTRFCWRSCSALSTPSDFRHRLRGHRWWTG